MNKDMTPIAEVELPTSDGTTMRVGDLWRDRPVVLSWLRHYA